jgi:DNA polymerase III sliding clamp (beta) subunit (PCNA family)
MLSALKFVQGAVADTDYVPVLSCFSISYGYIRAFDGHVALCSPVSLDLRVAPNAAQFRRALKACEDTPQLTVTPDGLLYIQAGAFSAYIDCSADAFPSIAPEGVAVQLPTASPQWKTKLISSLKRLLPFVARDTSKPWANGVLMRGCSAYATNNYALAEVWLGFELPNAVNIPRHAIEELVRIGEEPTHLQVCQSSVTFHFSGNRWMRTQNGPTDWPDVSRLLSIQSNPVALPPALFKALATLDPFANESRCICLRDGTVSTSEHVNAGASVKVPGLHSRGLFSLDQLRLLDGMATHADLAQSEHQPCAFYGEGVRGVIVGMV